MGRVRLTLRPLPLPHHIGKPTVIKLVSPRIRQSMSRVKVKNVIIGLNNEKYADNLDCSFYSLCFKSVV